MKIRFVWFWKSFDVEDNFFVDLLRNRGVKVEIVVGLHEKCDLEIVSVYGPLKRKLSEKISRIKNRLPVGFADTTVAYPLQYEPQTTRFGRRIWYTGENVRPPYFGKYDGFLSYDQDDYYKKNVYLPLWYMHAGLFGPKLDARSGAVANIEVLTSPRNLNKLSEKFMCTFVGNVQPTRLHAIEALSNVGKVDTFGSFFGKPVANKIAVARDYRFVLCFENDLFPGYVTEKLIDAYLCGAIPVYWGDLGRDAHLNVQSFLNLKEMSGLTQLVEMLSNFSDSEYKRVFCQPLLNSRPNLDPIFSLLVT